jgi:hypothetical protein
MAANATAERAALIERFVHYDIVETFVQCLDEIGEQLFPLSVLSGEEGQLDWCSSLFIDKLWPLDADIDSAEAQVALARSSAGVAHVFATLATDKGRDFCARQAAHFASLAAKKGDDV